MNWRRDSGILGARAKELGIKDFQYMYQRTFGFVDFLYCFSILRFINFYYNLHFCSNLWFFEMINKMD